LGLWWTGAQGCATGPMRPDSSEAMAPTLRSGEPGMMPWLAIVASRAPGPRSWGVRPGPGRKQDHKDMNTHRLMLDPTSALALFAAISAGLIAFAARNRSGWLILTGYVIYGLWAVILLAQPGSLDFRSIVATEDGVLYLGAGALLLMLPRWIGARHGRAPSDHPEEGPSLEGIHDKGPEPDLGSVVLGWLREHWDGFSKRERAALGMAVAAVVMCGFQALGPGMSFCRLVPVMNEPLMNAVQVTGVTKTRLTLANGRVLALDACTSEGLSNILRESGHLLEVESQHPGFTAVHVKKTAPLCRPQPLVVIPLFRSEYPGYWRQQLGFGTLQ